MFNIFTIFIVSLFLSNSSLIDGTNLSPRSSNIVICGDSRVVGLAQVDGLQGSNINDSGDSGIYYYAKVGEGLDYIRGSLQILDSICSQDTILCIALGINDLYNIEEYKEFYNTLNNYLNYKSLIICRVGSVNEEKESKFGYSVSQKDIDYFNSELLYDTRPFSIIDIWYGDESLYTTDGVHYTHNEYKLSLEKLKGVPSYVE